MFGYESLRGAALPYSHTRNLPLLQLLNHLAGDIASRNWHRRSFWQRVPYAVNSSFVMSFGLKAERLFADLCNQQFLRGFVFHSPRFYGPTEKEVGDVALWVRRQIIVVEILAREAEVGASTKEFVKRIGEKRQQLENDYEAFLNPDIDIRLTSEQGDRVPFNTRDLGEIIFSGIILLDCDDYLEKPHFGSVSKSLSLPFPVAIMTRRDFLDLMSEVDTIPDLSYYLADRAKFVERVFPDEAYLFLDLNRRLERNLISFYKLNENNFPIAKWEPTEALGYHELYQATLKDQIAARNAENDRSHLIDDLIETLRSDSKSGLATLIHSWELASLTRRQRASPLFTKIADAIARLEAGNPSRHFAFFNQATGCWSMFYFQYGGGRESFRQRTQTLTRHKLFVEMRQHNFGYSVFGYGFRKSAIETGATFDGVALAVEDANAYDSVPNADYQEALQYFGARDLTPIKEFPS